jgi:hypothetical protein
MTDKLAGGPGSGVGHDNTLSIGLPLSQYVSLHRRRAMMDMLADQSYVTEIPLSEITAVSQEKYVPKKLGHFLNLKGEDLEQVKKKPIDVLQVGAHQYHVMDGHHRYLRSKLSGEKTIVVRVYPLIL